MGEIYRHIALMGPPGGGKGTQAAILSEKLGIRSFSAGDLLRAEVARGTQEGREIEAIINKGNLVPSRYIVNRIREQIVDPQNANGYILDGFPRTVEQTQEFEAMQQNDVQIAEHRLGLDLVLLLQVPDDYVVERIIGRYACAKCGALYHEKFKQPKTFGVCDVCGNKEFTRRADDTYETVISRLRNYRSVTAPVIPYYEEKGLLKCIDGTGPIDVVAEKIRKVVGY